MGQTKIILGFIAGASLGAIAGILLAPDSGTNTRKKIVDTTSDLKDSVKDSVKSFVDKLQKGADDELMQDDRNAVPKMNSDN